MRINWIVILAVMVLGQRSAWAGSIASSAFLVPVVDDFTGLGLPTTSAGPLIRPEGTLTFSPTNFRYVDLGSTPYFGEAIGTDFQVGSITISLSAATPRAGIWLGTSSGTVEFFDSSNTSLGSLNYTPPIGGGLSFFGWEDLSDPIKKVVVTDTNAQDGAITFADRLTTEAVPEPASLALLAIAGSATLFRRRSR